MLAATNPEIYGVALGIGVILGAAIVLFTVWLLTSRTGNRHY